MKDGLVKLRPALSLCLKKKAQESIEIKSLFFLTQILYKDKVSARN